MRQFIALMTALSLNTQLVASASKEFDGSNDYVDISSVDIPIGSAERTFTMWFSADSWTTAFDNVIFNGYGNAGTGNAFYIDGEDNAVAVAFNGHRIITPKSALSNGTWYHVAVRVPNGATTTGEVEVFIDGVQQTLSDEAGSSTTLDSQLESSARPVIGGETDDTISLDGRIADVRIYDRALSDREIEMARECMNQPVQNLIGHWTLLNDGDVYEDIAGDNADASCSNCPISTGDGPSLTWCGENT